MNKITLTADIIEFSDDFLRKEYPKLTTKIEKMNERSKKQTIEIRELNQRIKALETAHKGKSM